MSKPKKEYRIDGRPHTIYRVVKSSENPYVMIDRRPIDNPALSYKAKGILTYLMSRPDGWEVSVADLINHATDGEDSVRSGLKELRVAGHMKYTKMREKGRITGWLIEVYELPHSDFQHVVIPDVGKQDKENPTQVISNSNRTERNKKERLKDDDEEKNSSSSESESSSSISERAKIARAYWKEVSNENPPRVLSAAFNRLFVAADELGVVRGESINSMTKIIDTTFLNNPNFPANYAVECINTQIQQWNRVGFPTR